MAWIDHNLEKYLSENFKGRNVKGYYAYRTRQTSRYIYVTTCLSEENYLHYEYYQEHVELHLEGKFQSEDYRLFAKELRVRTARNSRLVWLSWQGRSQCRCRISGPTRTWEELLNTFREMMAIFDPLIEEVSASLAMSSHTEPYIGISGFRETGLEKDEVSLESCSLGQIFSSNLVIPDYQRNYCWEEKQITNLWASLADVPEKGQYHLGTIILQKLVDGKYAIIDGQQRLVTLTIILQELDYQGDKPLLRQSFHSEASKQHIASNKWLIKSLCHQLHDGYFCQKLLYNIVFSVLILKENRLDLAYTFFSNQNAKGVVLTDFDLLKAHHLRFISSERQQEHMAGRWNALIENKYTILDATLSTHLYRLRKWMRKRNYDPNEPHRVKEEFSAALFVPYIPPFGDRFDFYEKIQGGTHFFAYAETFVDRFSSFVKTPQVQVLRNHLKWESHWRYESVIETLLFGYYLKFGNLYLTEALISIAENIAQHRYTSRANYNKIREFAKDSEIIMMIDQASSPTFFLKECEMATTIYGRDLEEQGIEMRFYQKLEDIKEELFQSKEVCQNEI